MHTLARHTTRASPRSGHAAMHTVRHREPVGMVAAPGIARPTAASEAIVLKATVWVLASMSLTACGGIASSSSGGADSGDERAARDASASTDGAIGGCPSELPANGSSCESGGLVCEYGASFIKQCNRIATCHDAQWSVNDISAQLPECSAKNPTACPASSGGVPIGKSCSAQYPTRCNYPDMECGCVVATGGPLPEDATAVATWYCSAPKNSACPTARPRLGSTCHAAPSIECDYGACVLPGGTILDCVSGVWQETSWGCPP